MALFKLVFAFLCSSTAALDLSNTSVEGTQQLLHEWGLFKQFGDAFRTLEYDGRFFEVLDITDFDEARFPLATRAHWKVLMQQIAKTKAEHQVALHQKLTHQKLAHQRRLGEIKTDSYKGVRIQSDDSILAFGGNLDVKLVRTGPKELSLVADLFKVGAMSANKILLNGVDLATLQSTNILLTARVAQLEKSLGIMDNAGKLNKKSLDTLATSYKLTKSIVAGWKQATSLSFTVYDHGADPAKKIPPKYTTMKTAEGFKFSSAGDYDSTMLKYCQEFTWRFPGYQDWFTEPMAKNLDKKISVYWSVSVGDAPHPKPKPFTRITIQMNQNGAYHHWTLGGPAKFYDKPRLFNNDAKFANFNLGGQSYGVHNYDDIGALLEYQNMNTGIGTDKIRICNLGPKNIYVKAIYGILHGTIKNG